MKNEEKIKITRLTKENKTKILTVRLTPDEHKSIEDLKSELEFESVREFMLYGYDVINQLKTWQKDSYKFYIHKKDKMEEFREVEFELLPINK